MYTLNILVCHKKHKQQTNSWRISITEALVPVVRHWAHHPHRHTQLCARRKKKKLSEKTTTLVCLPVTVKVAAFFQPLHPCHRALSVRPSVLLRSSVAQWWHAAAEAHVTVLEGGVTRSPVRRSLSDCAHRIRIVQRFTTVFVFYMDRIKRKKIFGASVHTHVRMKDNP